MNIKYPDVKISILLSFIFILITNNYFSYSQSVIFGAADGADYFLIADKIGNIPQDTLSYHKAWRFLIPSLIGIIVKIFNFDTYITFRFSVIIISLFCIFVFFRILENLKFDKFNIFFLSLIFICNPYLFRFFIANPTMLNDLVFIFSALLITLSYISNKKIIFYIGLILGLITRQNAIFYLISIIIVKLIYKKKSFFQLKDIFFSSILTFFIFILNNKFSNLYTVYNDSYSLMNRLNIFTFEYSLNEFLIYNLFLLIIIIPIVIYIFLQKKNFLQGIFKKEFFVLIFLITFFICSVAYVGGPLITGRNIIRLCNLTYPLIIILFAYPFVLKENLNNNIKYLYLAFFCIWSLHPTFSNIEIFSILKNLN